MRCESLVKFSAEITGTIIDGSVSTCFSKFCISGDAADLFLTMCVMPWPMGLSLYINSNCSAIIAFAASKRCLPDARKPSEAVLETSPISRRASMAFMEWIDVPGPLKPSRNSVSVCGSSRGLRTFAICSPPVACRYFFIAVPVKRYASPVRIASGTRNNAAFVIADKSSGKNMSLSFMKPAIAMSAARLSFAISVAASIWLPLKIL